MNCFDSSTFDSEAGAPRGARVSGVVTALTLTVAFGLLAAGFEFFWVAFVVGFGGVMPIAVGLAKRAGVQRDRPDAGSDSEQVDALDELRRRYARGDLTDAEFERRLERLLETESVADARATVDRMSNHGRYDGR